MIHMEAMKGIVGGGGRVGVGEDDMGDGMQCTDHPYRTNPGGICAFCLQEKLGKLVSSSFPLPLLPSSDSSSSPSFRSDTIAAASSSSTATTRPSSSLTTTAPSSSSLSLTVTSTASSQYHHDYCTRKTRLPFLLVKKKKKPSSNPNPNPHSEITLKRSKSTVTPRRGRSFVDAEDEDFSPRKRHGFWSFLHLSSKTSYASTKKLNSKSFRDINGTPRGSSLGRKTDIVVVEDDNSPISHNSNTSVSASASSFERKISRSRSVGCGSRSFSGDFFERISTGFGDCTLRRVESQREGKPKASAAMNRGGEHHHHCMKERVRCGGIFSGFMMTSSSSSSSSSSYWVPSSAEDSVNVNGKSSSASVALSHNRGRSWGWAFASPMRAFSSKPSSKENRRDIIRDANDNNKSNATPNLSAIPSLLAAR